MPTNIDDYVHRIGRTGRADNKGTAIAFVDERSKVLRELHAMHPQFRSQPRWWWSSWRARLAITVGITTSDTVRRPAPRDSFGGDGGGSGFITVVVVEDGDSTTPVRGRTASQT